jgi:predicted O-methyltransferase YrrM
VKVAPRLTVGQTDALATKLLEFAHGAGVLRAGPPDGLWSEFHSLRDRLYETFDVPDTTLTPLAARVLYGLAAIHRPGHVAVLGSYAGNLMAFTTGPVCGPFASYPGTALGLDTDAAAIELARANFRRAGYTGARVACGDAFEAAEHVGSAPVDLLLVDIDVPGARKSGYLRLVQAWLPYLAPGALIIAHDIAHPKFTWDLRCYRDFVLECGAEQSTSLPTDECGLEVTSWRGQIQGDPAWA